MDDPLQSFRGRAFIFLLACALILFPCQLSLADEERASNLHCSLIDDELREAMKEIKTSLSQGDSVLIFFRHEVRFNFSGQLKPCGIARAKCLADEFKKNDIHISGAFSTDYDRTKDTAKLMTEIESPVIYELGVDLKEKIKRMEDKICADAKGDEGCGRAYLAIGHSSNLAGMLNPETKIRRDDEFFKNHKRIYYIIKPAKIKLKANKLYRLKSATTFQPASMDLCE